MVKYIKELLLLVCFLRLCRHTLSSVSAGKCRKHEVFLDNRTLPTCEGTCANPTLKCIESPLGWSGCHCKPNFLRSKIGKCVGASKAECWSEHGICGSNEYFASEERKKKCERTCRVKKGKCPSAQASDCYCIDGFYRNDHGLCVWEGECADYSPKCGRHEYYVENEYMPTCEKTCSNPDLPCVPSNLGWKGCRCKPGYLRFTDGKCVRATKEKCKKAKNKCIGTEVFFNARRCETTCRIKIGECKDMPLRSGCFCKNLHYRDPNGVCVHQNLCNHNFIPNTKTNVTYA